MARRNTSPPSFNELMRKHAREGESPSATILRMFESGDLAYDKNDLPAWMGSGESGLSDLGINAEKYLGIKPWGPGEKSGEWRSEKDPD